MKLLNFMESVVRAHKKCYKTFEDTQTLHSDNFMLEIGLGGIDVIRKEREEPEHGLSSAHSVFTMNTVNAKVQHQNNAIAFVYGISSFFRASSEETFKVQEVNGSVQMIDLPRYNDNEEELLFILDTITGCSMPIVMSAILMTLDTTLASMYTFRLSYSDLDEIIELLGKV